MSCLQLQSDLNLVQGDAAMSGRPTNHKANKKLRFLQSTSSSPFGHSCIQYITGLCHENPKIIGGIVLKVMDVLSWLKALIQMAVYPIVL